MNEMRLLEELGDLRRERDGLLAECARLREALQETADLDAGACMFDMCDGPDAPFVDMKTCRACYAIQRARGALAGAPTPHREGT